LISTTTSSSKKVGEILHKWASLLKLQKKQHPKPIKP
jgi:hypothetical protein